jgi:glycine hydroxymethyltransferase
MPTIERRATIPAPASPERDRSDSTIEVLLEKHDRLRLDSLNLIVSENRMSARARAPLSSDIQSRYAASFYAGTTPAQEIVAAVTESASRVFRADHVNLAPVSGNMCLLAVLFALTDVGDGVGRVPPFFPGGGYPFNYEVFDRKPLPLPFSESDWQLDLPKTLDLLEEARPPLVILGSSIVTYPMPVQEVSEIVHGYGGLVAYDGSHSLGLIAGGQYQDPLREGADLLFGSTHKTFPGPQGGMILTNDPEIHRRVELLANFRPLKGPTLVCNPHLARIASTGIVLQETQWEIYARQVIENARTIAGVLHREGVPLHGTSAAGYSELTYCHQVITGYNQRDSARLRNHLARHRINVDAFVRLGTAEITRLGFRAEQCTELGQILAFLLQHEQDETSAIDRRIDRLIDSHRLVVL